MATRAISGGSMERGFLLDGSYGRRLTAKWIEGSPQYQFSNFNIRSKRQLEIESRRCRRCGFLESYAN